MRHSRIAMGFGFAVLWVLPAFVVAQTKEFRETVPLEAGGSLQLEGSKGSITLTGWDRDEVEIQARIEAPTKVTDDYAQRAVDATSVDVRSRGSSVSVRSNYEDVPKNGWRGRHIPSIHYEIRAPRRLNLSVESDRGRATISGFEGRITIDADRGAVDLRDLSGELRFVLDRAGNSRMSMIRGSFDLEADRTDVRMEEVHIEQDSRLELDRGEVEIDLQPSQALTVKADLSRRAHFDTELPMTKSSRDGRDFDGTINGGGPQLVIESDRGSVQLNAR